MSIQRIKSNLLHINNLRKALGYSVFRNATKSELKLEILKTAPKGNVLVLAPHPDDDVFGCGGTLKLHTEQGDKVTTLFFTNINTERASEAKKAAEILGVSDIRFLDFDDGAIALNNSVIKQLSDLINDYKPRIIYAPSFLDPNPDHFETCRVLYEALGKAEFSGQIYSYEIWSPIYVNRLVSIDSVFRTKKEALAAHKSQLKNRNYLGAMTGLASYRAGMFNAGEYAEGFFACNKELYIKLFDLINFKS